MPNASVWSLYKRIGLGLMATLFLLAGALFVLPHFVSEQSVRNAVSRSLIAATGIVPRIEGGAQLSVFPLPAIRLESVKLDHGAAPGFSAGSVHATVRLLPLLTGDVQVASLTFERPNFSIESRESGFVILGLPLRAPSAGHRDDIQPPELRIMDGQVELRGVNPDRTEVFTSVDASIAWIGSGVTAAGRFVWQSLPLELTLSIADTIQLNKGANSGFRLRVDSEVLRLAFEGNLRVQNGVLAEGSLAADSVSLRRALALIPLEPLTEGGFGPFKLKAQAALTPAALTLSGLSLDLDSNRSEGVLSIKREAGRTLLQATLASDSADFTPYTRGIKLNSEDGYNWNRDFIELSQLSAFDLDLRLSSKRIVMGKTTAAPVAASVIMKGGQLAVSVGEAGIYGGKLRGRAAIGPSPGGDPLLQVEANLLDFDLERGIGEITGIRRMEGKGMLDLALEGRGPHAEAIVRNVSGRIQLSAAQGTLNGINVEQALRRLERRPLSGAPDLAGGRTLFDKLALKLAVENGKAQVEEANIENQLVRVRLGGEASIVHRDLELRGNASLMRPAAAAAQPGFDMPFVVQGSWTRPYLLPDAAAILQRTSAAEAARKQQEREKQTATEPVPATPTTEAAEEKTPAPGN
jgi:AsmA protein